MKPTIQVANGAFFNFLRPDLFNFDILVIAHSLANLCRFTGHTVTFYSVAQHSVLVSHAVPQEHALAALLHDAHEAFVGDVSSPLKALIPQYKDLERQVETQLRMAYGVPVDMPPCVKQADLRALAAETRDLMVNTGPEATEWIGLRGIEPLPDRIYPWSPETAALAFLDRFTELQPEVALEAGGFAA